MIHDLEETIALLERMPAALDALPRGPTRNVGENSWDVHQYREGVGPWSAYLGVMQCAGHSG